MDNGRHSAASGHERSRMRKAWQVFLAYFSSMLFAFTGGAMTLPLLQQQLAEKYRLLSGERVLELFALGQVLPGVVSLNAGLLIGREIAGWPGAIAAAAGCVLPAFFGMLLIALSYTVLSGLRFVAGFIEGVRAASVAIILQTVLAILGKQPHAFFYLLAALAFAGAFILKWNVVLVVIVCGLAGVVREVILCKGRRNDAG